MGIELLFIVSVLLWLGALLYLLFLHVKQRKLARDVDRLRGTSAPTDEKRQP